MKRFDDVNLYDNQTKAGEFVAADGSVRQAGIVDERFKLQDLK